MVRSRMRSRSNSASDPNKLCDGSRALSRSESDLTHDNARTVDAPNVAHISAPLPLISGGAMRP